MKRLSRVAAAALLLMWAAALPAAPDDATALFTDRCSVCHSIGGGDLAGPDLVGAKKLPDEQLHAAVKRMQDNAGAMTSVQIESLVALLKDPAAKDRIAGTATAPPAPVEIGSAPDGRRLFYGERRLQNGGVACAACHAAAERGGNLAANLTATHARLGDAGILGAAERPGFPMMKSAYTAHPVTHAEAVDVAAFLRSTAAGTKPGAKPRGERTGAVHGTATGVAVAFFTAVIVLFRSKANGRRAGLLARRDPPSRRRSLPNAAGRGRSPAAGDDARTPHQS